MHQAFSLTMTSNAVAELFRQSAFAGTPGLMHLDLLEDSSKEGWLHIRLRPGHCDGVPIARADGVTLYAPNEQLKFFKGLKLNYYGDVSGGGFLITTPEGARPCACGAGFQIKSK